MIKTGDTVRYLNAVGGGIVTRTEGKIVYVEENGFETPVLASEVVVVLPAGHQSDIPGHKKMFDQEAFDAGRSRTAPQPEKAAPAPDPLPEKVEETPHGEKINLQLAFEPDNLKNLAKARFNAVLVNDSNYFLDFTFLRRAADERGWSVVFRGTCAPNELIDLASYTHEDLPSIERVAIQAVPYKRDREFTLKNPVSIRRRLDLTKFYKLHCFRPGLYFETPVLEMQLLSDDLQPREEEPDRTAETLSAKFNVAPARQEKPKKKKSPAAENPHKLLPPIEIDLHAGELLDTTAGLSPADILNLQLDTVRKTMKSHSRRIGQKIIFIHGKGEGVLRQSLLALLRKEFPSAEIQDASFQEYGFGATLVTIHTPKEKK
ncbi:MAG: DUF2027 domain-containing protein [Bacteroidales bacterium]|nr:DUF2027 domain-containing protein [Bacteroidales bacterium]